MFKIILFFFGLILNNECIAQDYSGFVVREKGVSRIEGKIKNYIPSDKNGFISFRTFDVTGRLKDSAVTIDKNGSFNCSLYQPFEADIALMYDEEYIDMYTIPSENIFIEIDESKWKKAENKNDAITFKGKAAGISQMIVDFNYDMGKQQFANYAVDLDKSQKTAKGFAVVRHSLLKKELDYANLYIARKRISNKKFISWAKNKIIYTAASEIATFGFYGTPNRTNTHQQLIGLLKPIQILNPDALHNTVYFEFLNGLTGDFQIIINVNSVYKDSIRQMGDNHQLVIMKQIDRYSNGIAKQLMYYDLYNPQGKENAFNRNQFESVIKQTYLKSTLQRGIEINDFEPYSLAEKIMQYPGGESLIKKLALGSPEQKGEFVYMDFWGIWCGPCMGEMPHYPKLIKEFLVKPIRFLFLAVETTQEEIRMVKTKYDIDGQFIALTGNEASILKNALKFQSYPRHFVVGPSGMVLNNQIGSIVSGDELSSFAIDQINKSLKMQNTD